MDISDWRDKLSKLFDLKEGESFVFSSPVDYNYNCLSWALSCDTRPFENAKGAFWPWKNISDDTVDGWASVCKVHGFVETDNAEFVHGYEKIAIFVGDNEDDLHAARQDRNGVWKSKLGDQGPDIDHADLGTLKPIYGEVRVILQRRREDWG